EMITTSNTMETKLDTILYLLTSSDEEFIPTVRNYYDGYTAQESFYPANAILGNLDDIIDG
ncbi:MAG: hypothetical protein NWP91_02920, partial [Rickettsiaceae bacterium]|nr:hypothetical protein [Rickettsiaceae bacterium]